MQFDRVSYNKNMNMPNIDIDFDCDFNNDNNNISNHSLNDLYINNNNNHSKSNSLAPFMNNNSNNNTNSNNNNNNNNNNIVIKSELQWSRLNIKLNINNKASFILLPSNFMYTPILSPIQPFSCQQSQVPYQWSKASEILMCNLPKFSSYFNNKIVLELGNGFGIGSLISLLLNARHTYITDNTYNRSFSNIIPVIFNKNNILASKYLISRLIYNKKNDIKYILKDCRSKFNQQNIDIIIATDILSTISESNNFFETISYFFEIYINQQKLKYRKKKRLKEIKMKKQFNLPNQFHIISNKTNSNQNNNKDDINTLITNGGFLPYQCLPKLHVINKNRSQSPVNSPSDDNDDDIKSHSNISTNSSTAGAGGGGSKSLNMKLPNTTISYRAHYFPLSTSSILSLKKVVTNCNEIRNNNYAYQYNINNNNKLLNHPNIPSLKKDNKHKISSFDYDDDDDDDDDYNMLNTSNNNDDDDIDSDNDSIMNNKIDIEEKVFLKKSKSNAPILIFAHWIKKEKITNQKGEIREIEKDDALDTFKKRCLNKGYRIQNIFHDWNIAIYLVKA